MKIAFKGDKPEEKNYSQRAEEDAVTTTIMTPLKHISTRKHGLSMDASIS